MKIDLLGQFNYVNLTAGTSFNSFSTNNSQPTKRTIFANPIEISVMADEELNNFDFITTHAGYLVFKQISAKLK